MAVADDPGPRRFFYGTKTELRPGDLIEAGRAPDPDEPDRVSDYVYVTGTLDAAAWEGELSPGDGPGRIYLVEPTGPITVAPDLPDRKYPGAPSSFRSRAPMRVTVEVTDSDGRPNRLYHGTKADLRPGDLIEPGRTSNFGAPDRVANHVYLSGTLDAAIWGAELASGDGPGRVYVVEPTGPIMDDPNLTNVRFPGNPTKSYRSREPLRVTGEVTDWQSHPREVLQAMRDGLEELKSSGADVIDD